MARSPVAVALLIVLREVTGVTADQCDSGIIIACTVGTFAGCVVLVGIALLIRWSSSKRKRRRAMCDKATVKSYNKLSGQDNGAFIEESQQPHKDASFTAEQGTNKRLSNSIKTISRKQSEYSKDTIDTGVRTALDDSHIPIERTQTVELVSKDFIGLGFNIRGTYSDGMYISEVNKRGPAKETGLVDIGDRVMSVTISMENVAYEDAVAILSYATPYRVRLQLLKSSENGLHLLQREQSSEHQPREGVLRKRDQLSPSKKLAHPAFFGRSQSMDATTLPATAPKAVPALHANHQSSSKAKSESAPPKPKRALEKNKFGNSLNLTMESAAAASTPRGQGTNSVHSKGMPLDLSATSDEMSIMPRQMSLLADISGLLRHGHLQDDPLFASPNGTPLKSTPLKSTPLTASMSLETELPPYSEVDSQNGKVKNVSSLALGINIKQADNVSTLSPKEDISPVEIDFDLPQMMADVTQALSAPATIGTGFTSVGIGSTEVQQAPFTVGSTATAIDEVVVHDSLISGSTGLPLGTMAASGHTINMVSNQTRSIHNYYVEDSTAYQQYAHSSDKPAINRTDNSQGLIHRVAMPHLSTDLSVHPFNTSPQAVANVRCLSGSAEGEGYHETGRNVHPDDASHESEFTAAVCAKQEHNLEPLPGMVGVVVLPSGGEHVHESGVQLREQDTDMPDTNASAVGQAVVGSSDYFPSIGSHEGRQCKSPASAAYRDGFTIVSVQREVVQPGLVLSVNEVTVQSKVSLPYLDSQERGNFTADVDVKKFNGRKVSNDASTATGRSESSVTNSQSSTDSDEETGVKPLRKFGNFSNLASDELVFDSTAEHTSLSDQYSLNSESSTHVNSTPRSRSPTYSGVDENLNHTPKLSTKIDDSSGGDEEAGGRRSIEEARALFFAELLHKSTH